jgi:sporulation protein YunB
MPAKRVLFVSLILFVLFTSMGIWLVNEQMKPALLGIAVTQAEQLGNYAINYGTGESVLANLKTGDDPNKQPGIDANKLIVTHLNNHKEISYYYLDSGEANRIKTVVSNRILWFLRAAEKGQISMTNGPGSDLEYLTGERNRGIIADIPLGQIMNNALLSNYGPRVPVKMDVVSNVQTDLRWNYQNIGINNIVFMIYLDVKVKVDVIVPFAIQSKTISQHIPVASSVLPKGVPYYYSSGASGLSPALPVNPPGSSNNGTSANGQ